MVRVCKEVGAEFGSRPHFKIAFNLTARHFDNEDIVEDVRRIFKKSPIKLSQVCLEVTERQPFENLTEDPPPRSWINRVTSSMWRS